MTQYVDCLASFLDELAIGAAHVCGLSWGGVLAQEFYNRYRRRVRSLALADTYAGWRGSLGEATAEERRASCLRDSERPARDWIPAWIPGLFTPAATAERERDTRLSCSASIPVDSAPYHMQSLTPIRGRYYPPSPSQRYLSGVRTTSGHRDLYWRHSPLPCPPRRSFVCPRGM